MRISNEGGRLAVVEGNIIRNLKRRRSDAPEGENGYGIYVEADTAVTGNVVENAANAGLVFGWGKYLCDVAVTGNVVRKAAIGVAVSVVPGAGNAVIASNVISGATRGAIVGVDHARPVTGDLPNGRRRSLCSPVRERQSRELSCVTPR